MVVNYRGVTDFECLRAALAERGGTRANPLMAFQVVCQRSCIAASRRFPAVCWRRRRARFARLAQEAEGCCRLASTKLVHRLNDPLAIW